MGNMESLRKLNFEDMKEVLRQRDKYILINTLPAGEQDCLILHSLTSSLEENTINRILQKNKTMQFNRTHIVCYGKNGNDATVYKKYEQLVGLGLQPVYVYTGGMFEWLMLQDIYGFDEFPTTRKELDFIRFRSPPSLLDE